MKVKICIGWIGLWCGLVGFGHDLSVHAEKKTGTSAIDSTKQARKYLSFGYRYLRSKQYEDAEIQLTNLVVRFTSIVSY